MPFDFELSFTGLCAFTFKPDKRTPREINALLVRTLPKGNGNGNGDSTQPASQGTHGHSAGHHSHVHATDKQAHPHPANGNGDQNGHQHPHLPLLTYWVRDLTPRSDRKHQIIPGPDGQPIGQRGLDDKRLEIVPSGDFKGGLQATWRPPDPFDQPRHRIPRSPSEEAWLDWILSLSMMDHTVRPEVSRFAGLQEEEATTFVKMTAGTLEASHVVRGLNGMYTIWDLREGGTRDFDPSQSQALAGMIVLRLQGLEAPVQIKGFGGLVEFAPPGPLQDRRERVVIHASITNLPNQELPMAEMDRPMHLGQYLQLARFRNGALRLPEASDLLDTPSSGLCPPITHGIPITGG